MLTVASFIVAIAILVAVHEWGHYAMAVASGVKVLRFSVGFGPRIWGWTSARSSTEFVVCALPLGGYVKMLDEREGAVDPKDRHLAFNTQPLKVRAAVVVAGPLANLVLAVLLYSVVHWTGMQEFEAKLSKPVAGSLAAGLGMEGGERVLRVGTTEAGMKPVQSFEDFRWQLTRSALAQEGLLMEYQSSGAGSIAQARLNLDTLDVRTADSELFRKIGWLGPWSAAVVGDVRAGGAAAAAGLQSGDVVLQVDDLAIGDGAHLREIIRSSAESPQIQVQRWTVVRGGQQLVIRVTPTREQNGAVVVGRVNAMIGAMPATVLVRYGVVDGITRALQRTWEVSALTLRMMGKMVIGEVSLKNLSGPLTIADYAGKSAALGWSQFLVFLALISISLGVLNLLPLPVLDGGHLMYYLWELLTGKAVSDAWMGQLQRVGLVILLMMMSVAVFNDLTHLLG
ncbi:RIP metalloprotease RseP [Rhodoferax saidenbachensis]|uniref:Zinc metalloprotease n=1 Tax=Rhodoferax saidenbachensis TaxID=1484693 RepID=A0ABU1ZMB5_9BURK|nr:RIP metalloprotease RseP [Rhodoferax saidenbachensis]MDR7306623.1 regulator of sigma E protease [Rhodoferax saidenbachensis]